jgi:amino acid adenylation domain-containing protein
MSDTAFVANDGSPEAQQVARILLNCALLISRRHMSTEVSFSSHVQYGESAQAINLDLDIREEDHLTILLEKVRDIIQRQKSERTTSTLQPDAEQVAVKRLDDQWEIRIPSEARYAGAFDDTFTHVYSQICQASLQARISNIHTTHAKDKEWLRQNAIHPIPPPIPLDGITIFRQCARRWASKVAVEAWDGHLTYKELDEESTQLAEGLVKQGIQPGMILPLALDFSKWNLISLLATWKTGAAFFFLDPTHPLPRLQKLLTRVRARFVLTRDHLRPRLLALDGRVLTIQEVREAHGPRSTSVALPDMIDTVSPAYVIATSGSTGEPKAVVHTHFQFCSGALHQAELLGFSEHTRMLKNKPLIFAGAIPELLFTILKGGCVCIPRQDECVEDLPGCVLRHHVNMFDFSPSAASIHDPAAFGPRKRVLMGGEPVPTHTARRWSEFHDSNAAYGSTETNTIATCAPINTSASVQSVGPGAAHQYWIVDALNHDRLVPPGWLGEVVVEGHAIALEYMGDEKTTEKAFISTPKWYDDFDRFRPDFTRFFRSGDLGRITSDGTLEVHGRTDPLQVKLRGQRIELGEIEAATVAGLSRPAPLVAELMLPKGHDRPSVAVFIVASQFVDDLHAGLLHENLSLSISQKTQLRGLKDGLRTAWESSLPAFMRPTYIFPLAQLPRTATGKLDRRCLRGWCSCYEASELAPFSMSSVGDQAHRPLSTDTEIKVGKAVSEVLRVPLDNFDGASVFTVLGGDSLSAIQMSRKLRESGLNASASEVTASESLASLAALLDHNVAPNRQTEAAESFTSDDMDEESMLKTLGMETSQVVAILPTTDSQSRAIELGTGPERCFVYHFVLEFQGDLEMARLTSALQMLIDQHDVLRTVFTRWKGRILQIILKELSCPLESEDFADEESIQTAVQQCTTSDILIDRVPTKFWLYSTHDVPKVLVLRLSHAQFDGLSTPLLWESLAQVYSTQTPSSPTPQFSTYARAVLQTDPTPSIDYFRELLHDVPFTDLVQRPSDGTNLPQNRHLHRRLALAPVPGFTPAHLFEASWGYVAARASHARAVAFDQIVSGRQVSVPAAAAADFDVSRVVGACLNDVPVVVRFPAHQTVGQLLRQLRAQHAASAPHETLGFRTILGPCKPAHWPRRARMTSSVQYRGFDDGCAFWLAGVECRVRMVERGMDLEDLTVVVTPVRGVAAEFDVEFLFSDDVVDEDRAEAWFGELVRCVVAFVEEGAFSKSVEGLLGSIQCSG